ncbi:MAG: metallophosphoesterase [Spirochaetes bacterium]|nr:metallophosphoesterase [Spirochaetota bacterium]
MKRAVVCGIVCAVLSLYGDSVAHSQHKRGTVSHDFVVWAHSDIQPRYEFEKKQYVNAVHDVKKLFPVISVAIVAGDIPQFTNLPKVFLWFLEVRKSARVEKWLEIAGNHDWRDIEHYKQLVNPLLNYSYEYGNLLFLCMSNEKYGRRTWISDATFAWWAHHVKTNQDKIIVTVTHGALQGSGLPASLFERLTIERSERFAQVLKNYRVDIWISAHSHFPGWLPDMHVVNTDLGNTIFIDVGAIRADYITNSESRFLLFKDGSSQMLLRYRDHTRGMFIDGGGYLLSLSKKFNKGKRETQRIGSL